ncbi:TlpA disulfide reductase family protein [Saccharospirillum salsuginis]|uniref:Thiol:disulfide interchange protein n=1 Tax=Saccharospirillum salsuginis TaxID=418750 RepID=A0A918KBU5_9GAMM|nr:TlpA disulfide reductase family protein [Saccharospirillum salsuginis]GGX57764.1 thiol:disulfide interchange protein [Saccharospirillum salsuginis]
MNAITLGPLFIPADRLIFVASIIVLFIVSYWLERRHKLLGDAGLWIALGAGFGVGRLIHVIQFWPAYESAPLEILYLWQGGFHVWTGLVAALTAGVAWSLWRKQPVPVVVAPVLAGVAVWWGLSFILSTAQSVPERTLPDVLVSDLNGEAFSIAELQGQPTVINLWATWCGPCRREMPAFERAQQQWPNVRFVYANQGEDAGAVTRFLDEEDLTLDTVVLDRTAGLMDELESRGLPTTAFFDASGQLVTLHAGELSAGRLQQVLSQLGR